MTFANPLFPDYEKKGVPTNIEDKLNKTAEAKVKEKLTVKVIGNIGIVNGYLTTNEWAKMNNVKPYLVRSWINRGKLKAIRIGDCNFIKIDERVPVRKKYERRINHGQRKEAES